MRRRFARAWAAINRVAAPAANGGHCSSRSAVGASSPLQYSATSQPAASACRARSAGVPDSAFMARSSVTRTPSKPIRPRMIALITVGDNVAGRVVSQAGTRCAPTWPKAGRCSRRTAADLRRCRSPRRVAATDGCPRRRDRGQAHAWPPAGFPRQAARRPASVPAARRRAVPVPMPGRRSPRVRRVRQGPALGR